jgi:hypothetical protein
VVAGVVATAALLDTSAAHAGASVACAIPSTECPVAGASTPAPGACSSTASAALGERGAGSQVSGGAPPPSLSSSSSDDDEYSEAAGGESSCCSRSRYSSSRCSRHSRRRILRSLHAARSYSHRCAARALGLGVCAGQTVRHPRPPSARKSEMSESHRHVVRE